MKLDRRVLAVLVAIGIAPEACGHHEMVYDRESPVSIETLGFEPARSGPLELAGVWEMDSANSFFGGYSGLIALSPDSLLAINDRGRLLEIPRPDMSDRPPEVDLFRSFRKNYAIRVDSESLTLDADTGRMWIGVEDANRIVRFEADRKTKKAVDPQAMRDWPENGGPEAMTRLRDGRFLAIAEEGVSADTFRALLFPRDPVEQDRSIAFTLTGPKGFLPSDMTQLPDGRVAVLLRGVAPGFPLRFPVHIAVFDPARIAAGATIALQTLATVDTPFPTENYEGLAVVEEEGGWTFWLISDDNFARWQRTLLLKLRWERAPSAQRQKARK